MFFTRLGTLVAWLALLMATFRFGLAGYIMFGIQDGEQAAAWATRYFGTKSVGAVLDQAAVVAALAIGLGILAEISRAAGSPRE